MRIISDLEGTAGHGWMFDCLFGSLLIQPYTHVWLYVLVLL